MAKVGDLVWCHPGVPAPWLESWGLHPGELIKSVGAGNRPGTSVQECVCLGVGAGAEP